MFDKLEEVEARFEEIARKLADPAIVGNAGRLRELSKEHRELEIVVDVYRKPRKINGDISGNRELMATERDKDLVAMAQGEIAGLEAQQSALEDELRKLLIPKDPNDDKNVILEIRSGTGGDEAALFAGELFRMYSRYAEQHGLKVEMMSASEGTAGGFKEVIAMIEGTGAYSALKFESGVHRVQRVPATETQGRIHINPLQRSQCFPKPKRPTSRSLTRISRSMCTARAELVVSPSIRPTRQCASRTCPPTSSSSAKTSARSSKTRTRR